MVWIDEILSFSERQGHCRISLKSDGLYMDRQGLRASACLEFIAQAYGFISVCHHIYIMDPNSKPLSKAYLASMKDAELPSETLCASLKPGDVLIIKIDGVRQMGPIVKFRGQVSFGEQVLAKAEMKVFKEYQS